MTPTKAGRMFVEGESLVGESARMAHQRMMRQLDDAAAQVGCIVNGDITVMEYDGSPLKVTKTYRLEADVVSGA